MRHEKISQREDRERLRGPRADRRTTQQGNLFEKMFPVEDRDIMRESAQHSALE